MPLKTPEEYRESLRDGRLNYIDGESVEDVTTDVRFAVPIAEAARDFEYGEAGSDRFNLRTYETEDGDRAHRTFQIPRTEAELHKRFEAMPTHSGMAETTAVYMALLNVKDALAKVNPQYAENAERMYKLARDSDLRAVEVITDAKGDRGRKPKDQDDPDLYTHIVDKNQDGIIVRGAKLHITSAAIANELVVMPTKAMGPGEEEYAISFSIPVNTPGIKIINRAWAPPNLNEFDYPASSHHNSPEGFIIFEDVLVPWDRVFMAGEYQLAGVFANALGLWERIIGLTHFAERGKLFAGIAQLLAEYNGIAKAGHIQEKITEMIFFGEIARMAVESSLRNYQVTESGMLYPNPLDINVGKYYGAANFHMMVRHLHDISGGLVITQPRESDLRSEETGPYLRKYLYTRKDVNVENRMRLYNLIRDITADFYGGWELITALQAGGGLAAQRIVTYRTYDIEEAKQAAKAAAGITD